MSLVLRTSGEAIEYLIKELPNLVQKTPGLMTRIRARLNLGASANVDDVINYIRNNKIGSLLVAYEAGDVVNSVYQYFKGDPETKPVADKLPAKDGVTDTASLPELSPLDLQSLSIDNVAALRDEMEAIDRAARSVGGMQNLHALRRALSMSSDYFVLHAQLSSLGRRT